MFSILFQDVSRRTRILCDELVLGRLLTFDTLSVV